MKTKLYYLLFLVMALPQSPVTAQWYRQSFPGTEYLWKVSFANETSGWIVAHDFVYGTADGGVTWTPQDTSMGASWALGAIDANTAVYANYIGVQPYTRGIRRTTDGGMTWTTADADVVYYTDFQFITPQIGYAAGGTIPDFNSILRKTTDGGASWFTVSTIPQTQYGEFEGISFLSESEGWGITYGGTIYHTTDGGLNWVVQDSSATLQNMRDIQFTTPEMGWAAGGISSTMRLWRTTDGGESWIKTEQPGCSVREIAMMDDATGWVAGTANVPPYVAMTTDAGETWAGQDLIPSIDGFESISMVNETVGWGVACCGFVYKTTNGGVTSVDGEPAVPGSFSLGQNYPNPFNPKTRIDYTVGSRQSVVLKVFDLLGREVATLVNENKDAGTYSATLDGAGLTSGVYYYRMRAGGYVETRRLVLLR